MLFHFNKREELQRYGIRGLWKCWYSEAYYLISILAFPPLVAANPVAYITNYTKLTRQYALRKCFRGDPEYSLPKRTLAGLHLCLYTVMYLATGYLLMNTPRNILWHAFLRLIPYPVPIAWCAVDSVGICSTFRKPGM